MECESSEEEIQVVDTVSSLEEQPKPESEKTVPVSGETKNPTSKTLLNPFEQAMDCMCKAFAQAYRFNQQFFGEPIEGSDPVASKTSPEKLGLYALAIVEGIFYYYPWRLLKDSVFSAYYQIIQGINDVFIGPPSEGEPDARFNRQDKRPFPAQVAGFPGFVFGFALRFSLYTLAFLGVSRYACHRLACAFLVAKDALFGSEKDNYRTKSYQSHKQSIHPNDTIPLFLSYVNLGRLINGVIYGLTGLIALVFGSWQAWVSVVTWVERFGNDVFSDNPSDTDPAKVSDDKNPETKPQSKLKVCTRLGFLPLVFGAVSTILIGLVGCFFTPAAIDGVRYFVYRSHQFLWGAENLLPQSKQAALPPFSLRLLSPIPWIIGVVVVGLSFTLKVLNLGVRLLIASPESFKDLKVAWQNCAHFLFGTPAFVASDDTQEDKHLLRDAISRWSFLLRAIQGFNYLLTGVVALVFGSRQSCLEGARWCEWLSVKLFGWAGGRIDVPKGDEAQPFTLKWLSRFSVLSMVVTLTVMPLMVLAKFIDVVLIKGLLGLGHAYTAWKTVANTAIYSGHLLFGTPCKPFKIERFNGTKWGDHASDVGVIAHVLAAVVGVVTFAFALVLGSKQSWSLTKRAVVASSRFFFGKKSWLGANRREYVSQEDVVTPAPVLSDWFGPVKTASHFGILPWMALGIAVPALFVLKTLNLAFRFFVISDKTWNSLKVTLGQCRDLLCGYESNLIDHTSVAADGEQEPLVQLDEDDDGSESELKETSMSKQPKRVVSSDSPLRDVCNQVGLLTRGLQGVAYGLTFIIAAVFGSKQSFSQVGHWLKGTEAVLFDQSNVFPSVSAARKEEKNWHRAKFWSRFSLIPWTVGLVALTSMVLVKGVNLLVRAFIGSDYSWKRLEFGFARCTQILLGVTEEQKTQLNQSKASWSGVHKNKFKDQSPLRCFADRGGVVLALFQGLGYVFTGVVALVFGTYQSWRQMAWMVRGVKGAFWGVSQGSNLIENPEEADWLSLKTLSRFGVLPWLVAGVLSVGVVVSWTVSALWRIFIGAPYAWKRLGDALKRCGLIIAGANETENNTIYKVTRKSLKNANKEDKSLGGPLLNRWGLVPLALQGITLGFTFLWTRIFGTPYAWQKAGERLNDVMSWVVGTKKPAAGEAHEPLISASSDEDKKDVPPWWAGPESVLPLLVTGVGGIIGLALSLVGLNAANYYRFRSLFANDTEKKGFVEKVEELEGQSGIGGLFAKYNLIRALPYVILVLIGCVFFIIQILWKLTVSNVIGYAYSRDGYWNRICRLFQPQVETLEGVAKIRRQFSDLLHSLPWDGNLVPTVNLKQMVDAWENQYLNRFIDGFLYDWRKAIFWGKNTPTELAIIEFADAFEKYVEQQDLNDKNVEYGNFFANYELPPVFQDEVYEVKKKTVDRVKRFFNENNEEIRDSWSVSEEEADQLKL